MRLWSIHPKYLDAKGLVALWRETLLAQNVLLGNTKGYKSHPQLNRFKQHPFPPVDSIGQYLLAVYEESLIRDYKFNQAKIISYQQNVDNIAVTEGQLNYEFEHLKNKLKLRDQAKYQEIKESVILEQHPLFYVVEGDIEPWERT